MGQPVHSDAVVARAHKLYTFGYGPKEISEHLADEGHTVTPASVRAWLRYGRGDVSAASMRSKPLTLQEMADLAGMTHSALKTRLERGWGLERALRVPWVPHDKRRAA